MNDLNLIVTSPVRYHVFIISVANRGVESASNALIPN